MRDNPTPFEPMRAIFEAWAEPHVPTLSRIRDIDSNILTYRHPQVEAAWRAFHAGVAAFALLDSEQRDAMIAVATEELRTKQ